MKKLIILITALVLTIPTFSQFNISHGTEENERGFSIRTTPFDNGYIISGMMNAGPINNRDAVLVKTDANGSIVWQHQYGWNQGEVFNSVRWNNQVPMQGFFCLGTTNSVGAGTNDILFVRTDINGIPISVRTYGGPLGDEGHCLQVIWDSEVGNWGLIMVGETDNADPTIGMQIIKTNLNGNINRSVVISNPGVQKGYWIEQTNDGGFIAVGYSSFGCEWGNQPFNDDIFVVRLEPDLNVMWAKTYGGSPALFKDDVAYSVKEIEDGFVITGRTESYGLNNLNDVFVMKIDPAGNCTRFMTYGLEDNDEGFDILKTNPGIGYDEIITGYTTIDAVPYALLFTIDNAGSPVWAKRYGLDGIDKSFEMDYQQEGFVFAGMENSFGSGQFDIYHVEVDPSGFSNTNICEDEIELIVQEFEPCIIEEFEAIEYGEQVAHDIAVEERPFETIACGFAFKEALPKEEEINKSEFSFMVYPNPVSEKLLVQIPEKFYQGKISIHNPAGQLVYESIITDNILSGISIGHLDPGVYMATVTGKDGEVLNCEFLKK